MRTKWLDLVVLAYGAVLLGAGIDGFLHHKLVALITRVVAAAVVFGLLALHAKKPRISRMGTAALALVIGIHTGIVYFQEHGVLSLLLCLSSLLLVLALMSGHMLAMGQRKAKTA